MKNYKGTKGNWVKSYKNGSWLIQDEDTYIEDLKGCVAEVYWFNDGEDTAEANALLISKAPEMLEMLEVFVSDFDKGLIKDYQIVRDRFDKLIKQATEL